MTKKRDTPTQPLPDWMIGPCAETQGADVAEVVEAQREAQREAMIRHMVNRFLQWPLPESVCSDACVSMSNYKYSRFGTNLLTAVEARQMLEYVLGSPSDTEVKP